MTENRINTGKFVILSVLYALAMYTLTGCKSKIPEYAGSELPAVISPDYTFVSVPPNIAPLNFRIPDTADLYIVRFQNKNGRDFFIRSRSGEISIPHRKWKKLLSSSVGDEFSIDIYAKKSKRFVKYKTITNYVAPDSIDKYLVYRLIEPGFETWNKMGIYQRNLENFGELPVMLNSFSDGNCMNCHSFIKNSGRDMMFHMRGEHGGTVIFKDGELSKVDTKTDNTISAGVYPFWHSSGNFITYSVNNIVQSFHAIPEKKIEVYDTLSNVIVYDVRKNTIMTSPLLSDPGRLETFPVWSPDGLYLYFCSAEKKPMSEYDEIRYDLMRIEFDPQNSLFGKLDTVLLVSDKEKSLSFPRISPDGRYLMFCMADYGNFTIWHPESDLYLLDLQTGEMSCPEINSEHSESFHQWSSSGRWIVFSSRRDNGLYTRPYFTYFDPSGKFYKPFILPQKNSVFYLNFMKSYNIPELITSRVELNPRKLARIVETEPSNAMFIND